MNNEQLQTLYAAGTPAWERPEPDVHNGRIISSHAPKAPDRNHNTSERSLLDRIVAHCKYTATADYLAIAHQHLPELLTGNIEPPNWERIRVKLRDAVKTLPGCADEIQSDRARLLPGPDDKGAHHITAPAHVEGHALTRRQIVEVRKANGQDCEEDAQLVLGLMTEGRRLLIESCPYIVREVGNVTVVLDLQDGGWFDGEHWRLDGTEVVSKSGRRLADQLAGVDGVWTKAFSQCCDCFLLPEGAQDHRRHRLTVQDQRQPFTINIPERLQQRIEAAAKAKGQDVGQYIAECVA